MERLVRKTEAELKGLAQKVRSISIVVYDDNGQENIITYLIRPDGSYERVQLEAPNEDAMKFGILFPAILFAKATER